MKQQLLKLILALPVMLIGLLANAQVTTKTFKAGVPAELIETGIKDIPDIFIKAPAKFNKILKYGDNDNPHELRFRFGVAKKVSADVLGKAKIIKEKGSVTYLTTVTAENALSISLQFGKFFIPKDAIMRIYSNNEITDDITSNVNNGKTTWATRIYHGNSITISLKIPTAAQDKAILEINKVCFGFKEINGEISGDDRHGNCPKPVPGQSANCNVNVVCALGSNWQNERNSVALIYDCDGFAFTGALVMNTCSTNKPYILTAYHNFFPPMGAGSTPGACKFVFKYWRLSCDNNSEQYNETYELDGASYVSKYELTDFALLLLDQTPSVSSGVVYSGWNRGGGVPSMITTLHHPLGDVMKISQATSNISPDNWNTPGDNNHWKAIFDANKGIIQRGSSGAPIYDENHRIVGQIHGTPFGTDPCVNSPQIPNTTHCACTSPDDTWAKTSLSGKFSESWYRGAQSNQRLKDHLDPLNLSNGIFVTNTTSVSGLQPDQYTAQVQGDPSICNLNDSKVYSIDLPPGAYISSWGQSNSSVSVNPVSPNSVSVTYLNTQNASVTITANVVLTGPCNQGTYPRPKTIALGGANCYTRKAYQLVSGNWVQVGNCIRLTELRSIYQKGTQGKYGNTEYYTTVKMVESYQPIISKGWSYVSSSGSSGYPSFIVTGDSVQVFISNTLPYGWIRLRYTTTTDCGTYSEDYWFTPQPSTTSCPIINPCLVAERTEEIANVPSTKISLSPNPTNGQFKVLLSGDAKDAEIREVRVKNKMGIEVYRQLYKIAGREQTINLKILPTDIYIVEVFDGKKWMTEKLSLQH